MQKTQLEKPNCNCRGNDKKGSEETIKGRIFHEACSDTTLTFKVYIIDKPQPQGLRIFHVVSSNHSSKYPSTSNLTFVNGKFEHLFLLITVQFRLFYLKKIKNIFFFFTT